MFEYTQRLYSFNELTTTAKKHALEIYKNDENNISTKWYGDMQDEAALRFIDLDEIYVMRSIFDIEPRIIELPEDPNSPIMYSWSAIEDYVNGDGYNNIRFNIDIHDHISELTTNQMETSGLIEGSDKYETKQETIYDELYAKYDDALDRIQAQCKQWLNNVDGIDDDYAIDEFNHLEYLFNADGEMVTTMEEIASTKRLQALNDLKLTYEQQTAYFTREADALRDFVKSLPYWIKGQKQYLHWEAMDTVYITLKTGKAVDLLTGKYDFQTLTGEESMQAIIDMKHSDTTFNIVTESEL